MNYSTAFCWGGREGRRKTICISYYKSQYHIQNMWRGKHCSVPHVSVSMCWGGVRGHWLKSGMENRQGHEAGENDIICEPWCFGKIVLSFSPTLILHFTLTLHAGFSTHESILGHQLRVLQFKVRSHRLRAQSKDASRKSQLSPVLLTHWLWIRGSHVPSLGFN